LTHDIDCERRPLSGFSALAHYTAIAEPAHRTLAVGRKDWKAFHAGLRFHADPHDAPEGALVEIWRYAPEICGTEAIVDPLSLWLAIGDDPDERVEAAREELLEGLGW
jgi:hypothetical protein